jgi:hypothetical protein
MLFKERFLEGIRDGSITLAFRRWRRPSVRTGGTLLTPVGQLSILSVAPIDPNQISEADARAAGYESLAALQEELNRRPDGTIHRIELGAVREDPRVRLRESALNDEDGDRISARLSRLDEAAADGPWTRQVLDLIERHPAVRAGDLCRLAGLEKMRFKLKVRKLKAMGLTESLETGYRLSPRGAAFMRAMRARS